MLANVMSEPSRFMDCGTELITVFVAIRIISVLSAVDYLSSMILHQRYKTELNESLQEVE